MIAAEKSITRGQYSLSHWWSLTLTKHASEYIELKKEKRRLALLHVSDDIMAELNKKIKQALTSLREAQ